MFLSLQIEGLSFMTCRRFFRRSGRGFQGGNRLADGPLCGTDLLRNRDERDATGPCASFSAFAVHRCRAADLLPFGPPYPQAFSDRPHSAGGFICEICPRAFPSRYAHPARLVTAALVLAPRRLDRAGAQPVWGGVFPCWHVAGWCAGLPRSGICCPHFPPETLPRPKDRATIHQAIF